MKQIKILKLLSMMIIFSVLAFSCQKTDLNDQEVQTPSDENTDNTSINIKDYCGNTLTFPFWHESDQSDFGSLTIANDESNLIFNYDLINGYYIRAYYIFIINDGLTPPLTIADSWNSDGSANVYIERFPFKGNGINTQQYQKIITFDELENENIELNECLNIVAAATLYNPSTNQWRIVFAKTTLKSSFSGWYVDFCIEACGEPTCETAYAYGGDDDDCFLNLNTQGNKWGWSNGGIGEGTYQWTIYAGAGQCDISRGSPVGTLDIVYAAGTATITYNIDPGYTLEETHLHVGETEATRLPLNKKNKFITAPGQYDYSGGSSFSIDGLSGEIWVTAHSVVCGDFE